jgi:organic radical activating enzyme
MIPDKNTFCIAPFQHACLKSTGKLAICCVSKENKKYKYDQIEDWYNSDLLKELRSDLVNGVQNPICKTCWSAQQSNKKSQRQIYNEHIGHIIEDRWDKNFKQNKKLLDVISNINYKNINSFDLKLGNLCNLKCIMCSADSSSQLLAEARMYPEVQEFFGKKEQKNYQWPEREDFKEWCKTFLGSAIHIKFTGGEPFMNPHLLESLESIPDTQKKKCILHFSTNLTIMNKEIIKILPKFKETWLSVSVEGIDKVLEYARFGHKWKDLQKNLMTLLDNRLENVFVSISHVIQSPTFNGIFDLIEYFDKLKIKIEPLFLTEPKCFQLSSIKQTIKENFLERIKKYKGHNISYVISLRSHIQNNIEYNPVLAKQCVYRLEAMDKIRKNNFKEIIPIDYFI